MKKEGLHIIHKQVIEISTTNVKDAREIEHGYQNLVKQINSFDFEKCFDGLLPPDQHLFIERLEIDLGEFSKHALFNQLGRQLGFALRSALLTHLSDSLSVSFVDAERSPDSKSVNSIHKSAAISTQLKTSFEILLFFLEKGRLPAWAPLDYELDEEELIKITYQQVTALRMILVQSEQALLRFASSFSIPFIAKIFLHLDSTRFDPTKSIYRHWQWIDFNLLTTASEKLLFKRHYWSYALSNSLNEDEIAGTLTNIERIILLKTLKKIPEDLRISMRERSAGKTIPATLQQHLESCWRLFPFSEKSERKIPTYKSLSPFENPKLPRKAAVPSDMGRPPHNPDLYLEVLRNKAKIFRDEIVNTDGAVGVNDAGLVLLSPFFKELFQDCGFLEDDIFISSEMSARAVNLLVYLANGTVELPEYHKVLPKLLCGVLWETALFESLPLLDLEKDQANALLIAVVTHWKALRNSSPEALQETFIRRPGRLINGNPGIILEVEHKAQDVLLNHLPWSYSLIKLPWMPEMLSVRWA
jgi:hypothetical protein